MKQYDKKAKASIIDKVLFDILDHTNDKTTTEIVETYTTYKTWLKWIKADDELREEFELARQKYSVKNKKEIITLAQERLYGLVNNGDFKAIQFVLKNLTLQYNDDKLIEKVLTEVSTLLSNNEDISPEVLTIIIKSFRSLE